MTKEEELDLGINQGVTMPSPSEIKAEGVLDMAQFPIVALDANIDKYLSDFDPQSNGYFDTLGCNIFSSIAMCEIYFNAMGWKDYGSPTEFSERKACVDAGLNGTSGSSEQQWEDAISLKGLVKHSDWPFDSTFTKAQFFAPETQMVQCLGLEFLTQYIPYFRAVGTSLGSIQEALTYGAVKIFIGTGKGWSTDTVIQKTDNPMNHAVLVRYIDANGIHIRDQYAPFLKTLALDYRIDYAYQTLFKQKKFHYVFNHDLWYGKNDPDNVMLQMALQADGSFPMNVPFNQHFGLQTLKAVQLFQTKYAIVKAGESGYGRVGPKTRFQLNLLFK